MVVHFWLFNFDCTSEIVATIAGLSVLTSAPTLPALADPPAVVSRVAEQPREPSLTRGVGKYPGSNDEKGEFSP